MPEPLSGFHGRYLEIDLTTGESRARPLAAGLIAD